MANFLAIHISPGLLYSAAVIWPIVCISVVWARFARRTAQRAKIGPDDWLILPGLLLVIGLTVTLLAGTAQKALGYPTPKLAPGTELTAVNDLQTITRKAYYASVLLNIAALTFIKLSCIFFYRRIFAKGVNKTVLTLIWVLSALLLIWGIGHFFAVMFACGNNFHYFWTSVENQLKCPADLVKIQQSLAISDVLMDVIILIFPIPLIMRLRMSRSNKFAVVGIFFLGAISFIASVVRLVIILQGLKAQFAASADEDFVTTTAIYFLYHEACFALTAVCLPSLSGALKLKGVQNMVEGFNEAFSNLSRSSLRSRKSNKDLAATKNHERLESARPSDGDIDIELAHYPLPLPDSKKITVTNEIDQKFTSA
ncbi:hypothetical protein HYFRA_00013450 [Hymenoscyphus fraxineus]|uniref:Rhodopsin domain-containing protein n=1 Tax=Hymenoscyphus fraxineus TaxID=746836 RepID=A0A9N9Q0F3_9HELO|nr:hypothetical protein HYFRA_00013450 [Hymenoscyphus fraxineus]